jgi:hypothetical protein
MITDELGLILDSRGDGGDSANRNGLVSTFEPGQCLPLLKFVNKGICVRHPTQAPWNNPKNFARDQLIPLVSGLAGKHQHDTVKAIFWAHARRLFFCQNFERDEPGSTKYPWPHTFVNDKKETETRAFDFADFLFPGDVWHLIKCAKIYWLYWFALVGLPWFMADLYLHCQFNTDDDEGQIIAKCKVQGQWALRLYAKWRVNWDRKLWDYWKVRRDQIEIYQLLAKAVRQAAQ